MEVKKDAENTAQNQQVKRVVGRPFPPGVSGNPAGKPKGTKHFQSLFMEFLKDEMELKIDGKKVKMTMGQAMTQAMIRKAIRGDVQAFNAVSDRVDGKPVAKTELTGADGKDLIPDKQSKEKAKQALNAFFAKKP